MPNLLTVAEAACQLRITEKRLRELLRQGRFPAFKIGGTGQWRIPYESLRNDVCRSSSQTAVA